MDSAVCVCPVNYASLFWKQHSQFPLGNYPSPCPWDSDWVHLSPYFEGWVYHPEQNHQSCWFDVTHETQFSLIRVNLHFSQSRSTLCDPVDCSMPGFPVHYHLLELPQTHVHCVGDAIQPSQPLLSHSPLPSIFPSIRVFFNVSSSHQVAKVLEIQLQHQSFPWIFRADFL